MVGAFLPLTRSPLKSGLFNGIKVEQSNINLAAAQQTPVGPSVGVSSTVSNTFHLESSTPSLNSFNGVGANPFSATASTPTGIFGGITQQMNGVASSTVSFMNNTFLPVAELTTAAKVVQNLTGTNNSQPKGPQFPTPSPFNNA